MPFRHWLPLVAACAVQLLCGGSLRCQAPAGERTRVSIDRLPINFEQNQGQAGVRAQFLARSGSLYLEMLPAEVDVSLPSTTGRATLRLELMGGDPNARITPLERTETVTNYFRARNPSAWHLHIPNFKRIRYVDLYPGIDLLFYGKGAQLEHDFIVAPFADYRQIRMRARGARGISVQPDGSLKIALADGNVIFHAPDVYQPSQRGRQSRRGWFKLLSKDLIGFEIDDYDRSSPLVIDPQLSSETFLTNSPFLTFGMASDGSGNTYVSGVVAAPGTTQSPVGVLKLNAAGTALLYASYFGDSAQPFGGIAVDANGDAIVAVDMQSTNVPLKNPVEPAVFTGNGSFYTYVFSLSPDGSSQNYASLLGGGAQADQTSATSVNGVALDSDGNAYVAGITSSPVFPVTTGALNNNNQQPTGSEGVNYVTKFLTSGNLGYSALLNNGLIEGGGGAVSSIAVDALGSAYVTGTAGAFWPITGNAYQNQVPGGVPNSAPFVTKLSVDGSALAYSTFLGTEAQPTAITVNGSGEAFIAGENAPAGFPITSNAYQPVQAPNELIASFVTELSADGSQLLYSTFIHGPGQFNRAHTSVTSIAFDSSGDLWLGGTTNEYDFPMVHPLQSVPPTSNFTLPGFLARLDSHLASLTFSTFLGDLSQGAQSISIAVDGGGRVHVAGVNGLEMYTTPGAYIASVPAPPQAVDYLYGFSALIDPSVQAPSVCLQIIPFPDSPRGTIFGVGFGSIPVGETSTQKVVVTNCGELPLQISGEKSSDPAYTFPTSSTTQPLDFRRFGGGVTLACALACCLLLGTGVTAGRWRWGFALTVLFAASLCLSCGGGGSGSQPAPGSTGGVLSCNQSVPVSGSCSFSVSFTPTAAKSYPAVLTITSNSSMPTLLPLSGTGE